MLCIFDHTTDPAFNLAAEEFMLKNIQDNVFMLWRNHNAIIVGKHQNTLAEINANFVREKGIKVIRRLSGGGAVFHDMGNINFSFIMNGERDKLIDFKRYTLPIIEVLQKLGIDARFEGRNDITIGGKKFSGNAEHVYKSRILHHGTMLYSAKMTDLSAALNAKPEKFEDKGVKSVRSRVTNISDHLTEPMDVVDFANMVMGHIRKMYPDAISYAYSPADIEAIEQLKAEKYDTWEWNYGYSPVYNFSQSLKTLGGTVEVMMEVDKGIMRNVRFFGDFFNQRDVTELEMLLQGIRHEHSVLAHRLAAIDASQFFVNISEEDILKVLL